MITKDAPAFDFYPERWTHGTKGMTKVERTDYLDLLLQQWTQNGIEDDLPMIAVALGYLNARGEGQPKKIPARVLAKFPVEEDGRRRNPLLEEIRAGQRLRIASNSRRQSEIAWKRHHPGEPLPDYYRSLEAWQQHCRGDSAALPVGCHGTATALPEGCQKDAHHPPPTPFKKRESSADAPPDSGALLADAIAAAYPRQDDYLPVRGLILEELRRGTDATEMREAVQKCAGFIRRAPGGSSNRYVPTARTFFTEAQWRSPEAFEQRWEQPDPAQGKHPKGSREVSTIHTAAKIPKL